MIKNQSPSNIFTFLGLICTYDAQEMQMCLAFNISMTNITKKHNCIFGTRLQKSAEEYEWKYELCSGQNMQLVCV